MQVPRVARVFAVLAAVAACSSDSHLKPFSSDGCSLFPDRSQIAALDWCNCCLAHDIAYWRGGTRDERETADIELKNCVAARTGNEAFATLMYEGVRLGGSPYFYNWYRWGYGWSFDRKYQALTPEETQEATRLLEEFVNSDPRSVCPVVSGDARE